MLSYAYVLAEGPILHLNYNQADVMALKSQKGVETHNKNRIFESTCMCTRALWKRPISNKKIKMVNVDFFFFFVKTAIQIFSK